MARQKQVRSVSRPGAVRVRPKGSAVGKAPMKAPTIIRRRGVERDVVRPTRTMLARRARTTAADRHAGIEAQPLNMELVQEAMRAERRGRTDSRRSNVVDMNHRTNTFSNNGARRYNTLGDLGSGWLSDIGSTLKDATKQAIGTIGATAVQAKQAKVQNKQQAALLKQQQDIAAKEQAAAEAQERAMRAAAEQPFWENPKIMLPVAAVLALLLWYIKRGKKR